MQNLVSRRGLLKAGAFFSLAALAGCVSTKAEKPSGNGSDQTEATLGYVNALRKEKGLSPLANDPVAAAAALSQASRMAKNGKMSHLIGIGDSFLARMKGQGVWGQLLAQRFGAATRRLGLAAERIPLDLSRFRPPEAPRPSEPAQGSLF